MRREEEDNKEEEERDVEEEEEEVEEREEEDEEAEEREKEVVRWGRKRRGRRKMKSADCKKGTKGFAQDATGLHYGLTKHNNCNQSKAGEFLIRQINGSKLSGAGL